MTAHPHALKRATCLSTRLPEQPPCVPRSQAFTQQLCSNTATANASLASAILAGGAEAQKAFLAMYSNGSQTVCPDGTQLTQLFVDYVSARGTANAASARK